MSLLTTSFKEASRTGDLFASKSLIMQNAAAYEENVLAILGKHKTIVAPVALAMLLQYAEGKSRKNNITPSKFHQFGLVDNIDKVISTFGTRWVNPDKYGSIDALLSATLLHDMREDFGLTANNLRRVLEDGMETLFREKKITVHQHVKAYNDINHTIDIVDLLSRNEGGIMLQSGDRVAQARQWLKHPYAYLIKQNDWADKLSTMIGVDHFEKDNQMRMNKVLSETALLFVKEQQDMTSKACAIYPKMMPCYKAMEGIIGMLFQGMRTYTTVCSGQIGFSLSNASPFNFKEYQKDALPLLRHMHRGNNYISPVEDDLEVIGMQNPRVKEFLDEMFRPSLPVLNYTPVLGIMESFSKAVYGSLQAGWASIKHNLGQLPHHRL